MKPRVMVAAKENPSLVVFAAGLAMTHVDLGELDDAREEFDRLAADEFAGVRTDISRIMSLAILSDVCAHLGDAERAIQLYDLFSPHSGQLAVAGIGIACLGAVDRFLGMLAATNGDWEKAEAHYDAALALESRIESAPLLARTRTWYARMLLARHDAGDEQRARALLSTARATAESLGMAGVVSECHAMLAP
jgi:tetratricopeptide (TPR) repeat protein